MMRAGMGESIEAQVLISALPLTGWRSLSLLWQDNLFFSALTSETQLNRPPQKWRLPFLWEFLNEDWDIHGEARSTSHGRKKLLSGKCGKLPPNTQYLSSSCLGPRLYFFGQDLLLIVNGSAWLVVLSFQLLPRRYRKSHVSMNEKS